MKAYPILSVLLCALVLCSCGESKKPEPYFDYSFEEDTAALVDTLKEDTTGIAAESLSKQTSGASDQQKSTTASKNTSSYQDRTASSRHSTIKERSTEDDGMRGFDPASENDMHDNGMSRFMENDDNEGWN